MLEICNISHPFLLDPGQSQPDRYPAALNPDQIRIDDRELADLMDGLFRFSQQINYYYPNLDVGTWRPFFEKSLPFLLARINRLDLADLEADFQSLVQQAEANPRPESIQLLFDFMVNELFQSLHFWQRRFREEGSSFSRFIDNLIQANLQKPFRQLVQISNGANKWYCVGKQDFVAFQQAPVWGLAYTDLFVLDEGFHDLPGGPAQRLLAIKEVLVPIFQSALEVIREISRLAPAFLEESLIPLREEYRQNHAPQLGLLFAFLKLYRHLQLDINRLTQKHLEFFYRRVLHMEEQPAVPDLAHMVLETQKHINRYRLPEGTLLKDGKDANNADILFALEEEIVVDKAQVESLKTLYLKPVQGRVNDELHTFVEGVYMAPVANSADGLGKDFPEAGPTSWATLGAKKSKYLLPATPPSQIPEPHPYARLGFVLASPVLYLQEGRRKIYIELTCGKKDAQINDFFTSCEDLDWTKLEAIGIEDHFYITQADLDKAVGLSAAAKTALEEILEGSGPHNLPVSALMETPFDTEASIIRDNFSVSFLIEGQYTIDRTGFDKIKSELDDNVISAFNTLLKDCSPNFLPVSALSTAPFLAIQLLIQQTFALNSPVHIFLSGEQDWIVPKNANLYFRNITGSSPVLELQIEIDDDIAPVSFYDPEAMGEDLQTTLPLARIDWNQAFKIPCSLAPANPDCCLEVCQPASCVEVSLYQYLRCLTITDSCIDVEVCGLRNVVVQNDENIQDLSGQIFPFGARPAVDSNFYIGSKEIFCKNWTELTVNMAWKDKPSDFGEYYAAYLKDGLDENDFEIAAAVIEDGYWWNEGSNRKLFDLPWDDNMEECKGYHDGGSEKPYEQFVKFINTDFSFPNHGFRDLIAPLTEYKFNTQNGFLRIALKGQNFLHKDYAYVLALQMMAIARLPRSLITGAIYINRENNSQIIQFKNDEVATGRLRDFIDETYTNAQILKEYVNVFLQKYSDYADLDVDELPQSDITIAEIQQIIDLEVDVDSDGNLDIDFENDLTQLLNQIEFYSGETCIKADASDAEFENFSKLVDDFDPYGNLMKPYEALIPNEPWTPIIKQLSLDYTAKACKKDITLIHLYPCEGTYKVEDLNQTPPPCLLPTFKDEGTLFIGLKDLVPGSNLNLLFQLAEATADSETDPAEINWAYLKNNEWEALQPGFHLLNDGTNGLTRSGIVKVATPGDISGTGYTIMPPGLHWLKVSAAKDVAAICETLDIHTQAVLASFAIRSGNDTARLAQALPGGSIAKLAQTDSSIKKVDQPYETFGGRAPEAGGSYHRRISEHLRHKGRGIARFDYERLVLEEFPEIYKVKCINHDLGLAGHTYQKDLELAPGFVLLAVIPDLQKLKTSGGTVPKVPVSLLQEIQTFLKKKISPFIRLKVMNPRYERIHLALKVKLYQGKSEEYYTYQLEQDLRRFLAPWLDQDQEALEFGRTVSRSDLIYFIEKLNYVDYICSMTLYHEDVKGDQCEVKTDNPEVVLPMTARSVLTAGEIKIEAGHSIAIYSEQKSDCFGNP